MDARVVASPDGAHLAVLREHRLSLFALDSGKRVGVADVTGTDLAFVGGHVVVHAQGAHTSMITVLALPVLSVASSHELGAPTRLMAAANTYALLDRGDQALMVHCGRTAAVTPLLPPAAFTHAVGLEGPQFVTFGRRGAELWDAASRRPEARLRLELPVDTAAIGLTGRYATLWATTTQPCLHLARISDGRLSTLWLDGMPRNVRSHPMAGWVVADVGGRALAINVAVGDVVPIDAGRSAIVAVAPRRDRDAGAVVIFLDGDALELRLLGGEARPVGRRPSDAADPTGAGEVETGADAAGDETARPADPRITDAGGAAGMRGASLHERRPAGDERLIAPAYVVPMPAGTIADRFGGGTIRSLGATLGASGAIEVPSESQALVDASATDASPAIGAHGPSADAPPPSSAQPSPSPAPSAHASPSPSAHASPSAYAALSPAPYPYAAPDPSPFVSLSPAQFPSTYPSQSPSPSPAPHGSPSPAPHASPSPHGSPAPAPSPSASPSPSAAPSPHVGQRQYLTPSAQAAAASHSRATAPSPPASPAARVAAGAALAPSRPRTWRDELVAWLRTGGCVPAPVLDGSPLRALQRRLELSPAAWPIACALYARWLSGGGARGLATARLAALAGDASGWTEALGGGPLAAHGLLAWRHGRACLVDAAGDFLDGRGPTLVELIGAAPIDAPPYGLSYTVGDGAIAREHAVRLADELGQVAILATAFDQAVLGGARLEAWLRGLALVVVGEPGAIGLRRDESMLAVVPPMR